MQIRLNKRDLENCVNGGTGVEIIIPGVLGNPEDDPKNPCPIYIEKYDSKILVHIWNGKADPTTIELTETL